MAAVDGSHPVTPPVYATWGERVIAAVLDNAILAGVTWLALGTGIAQPTLTPGLWRDTNAEQGSLTGWMILVPIGALVILLVLQATTGWTPGKLVVGIRVVRDDPAGRPGPAGLWTTAARWVLHLLDAILLIGYLRPLWHQQRQTFADGIAHTIVVRALPQLSRRPRIAAYSAALVVCVLGIGYGCVPISSVGSAPVDDVISCGQERQGPLLTTGNITLGGSTEFARDRRMWTVRESRTALPGATISWTSDPSVRDADYRVELDALARSASGGPVVSRFWDLGTGGVADPVGDHDVTHTRSISPEGDTHVAKVEMADSDDVADRLGTDLMLDVRLIADGEIVAACGGTMSYGTVNHAGY
ncbi:RDD family protein [Promicromonospora vindobonensis]|uniref:RDD family protein n=1 Tax=Promicromonospora vindobonensis TaxID=195748 RepID=A0ABW5VSB5_9MICO